MKGERFFASIQIFLGIFPVLNRKNVTKQLSQKMNRMYLAFIINKINSLHLISLKRIKSSWWKTFLGIKKQQYWEGFKLWWKLRDFCYSDTMTVFHLNSFETLYTTLSPFKISTCKIRIRTAHCFEVPRSSFKD